MAEKQSSFGLLFTMTELVFNLIFLADTVKYLIYIQIILKDKLSF